MTSQWNAWLTQLARDDQGGLALEMPAIVRGLPWAAVFRFAADYSDNSFAGGVSMAPDSDAVLHNFESVVAGAFSGGVTDVTATLSAAQTDAMPADDEATGLVELVFELRRTPLGAGTMRAAAGVVVVSGRGA